MELELNNMDDLRRLIIDEIKELKAKTSSPAVANAIFNGSGKILSSVKLEIDYQKAVRRLNASLPLQASKILELEDDAEADECEKERCEPKQP